MRQAVRNEEAPWLVIQQEGGKGTMRCESCGCVQELNTGDILEAVSICDGFLNYHKLFCNRQTLETKA